MYLRTRITDYKVLEDKAGDRMPICIHHSFHDLTLYFVEKDILENVVDIVYTTHPHRCDIDTDHPRVGNCGGCDQLLYRIVEYYQDRHPLMLNLSKMDYLNSTCRKAALIAGCSAFKKAAAYKSLALQYAGMLPRELVRIVCCYLVPLFCNDYRVFPHYVDILVNC